MIEKTDFIELLLSWYERQIKKGKEKGATNTLVDNDVKRSERTSTI